MQKFAFLSILLLSVGIHAAPLIEIESTTWSSGTTETECPDDVPDTTPKSKPISQDDLSQVKEAISNYQAVTESAPPKDKEELNRLFKQFEDSLARKVGAQSQAQSQSQAADAGLGAGQTQAQSQSQGQGLGQTQAQSQSQGQGAGAGQTQAQSQAQEGLGMGMGHTGKHNHKHKHQHKHEMN